VDEEKATTRVVAFFALGYSFPVTRSSCLS